MAHDYGDPSDTTRRRLREKVADPGEKGSRRLPGLARLLGIMALAGAAMAFWQLQQAPGDAPQSTPGTPGASADKPARRVSPDPVAEVRRATVPDAPSSMPPPEPDTAPPSAALEIDGNFRFDQIPQAVSENLMSVYREIGFGNFDQAAHIARDTLEISAQYPNVTIELYYLQGLCYERLGYIDMAMAEYASALALYPDHRPSYTAMRRISPEFALKHEELPSVKASAQTANPPEANNEKQP